MTLSDVQIQTLPYRANVGVMVVNKDGKVFVAQRLDHHYDAWQMPQGGIDPGEDAQAAALRELEEETGISPELVSVTAQTKTDIPYDLPADLIPKLWGGKYRGQMQKWFLLQFHGTDKDINIATEHPEFSEWKWLDPADLPDAIVSFKRDVYVQILNEFQEYL